MGDLIDLSTPQPNAMGPAKYWAQQQQRNVNEDDDIFEFFPRKQDQGQYLTTPTAVTPPYTSSNKVSICPEVLSDRHTNQGPGEAAADTLQATFDWQSNDRNPATPTCSQPSIELDCPPTAPLNIPAEPSPVPFPSTSAAAEQASSPPSFQPPLFEAEPAVPGTKERPAQQHKSSSSCVLFAAACEEQPCSSNSRGSANESALEKDLAEAKVKLAKVEASRDSIARDLGQQKGNVAKLEGTVSSLDKRLKMQLQETQALKARLAEAEREAAVTNVTADVTPDRCRSSVRAMHEEMLRAQDTARQREAQVHKLQQLMAHEAEEAAQLQAFESQERAMLLASQASLQQSLAEQSSHVAMLLQQQEQIRERESTLEAELQKLRREVWDTKNQNIELMAEAHHIHGVATAAQAAATTAQQQAAAAWEAEAKCAQDLTTIRDAGVKLFKQIRAVVHALERNLHHFQKVPEVGLSIRQLHDWCAKHGPFWVEKGEEAAAAVAGAAVQPPVPTTGPAGPTAVFATGHGNHMHSAVTGGSDETMTVSLGHVMALGAGSTRA